LRGAPAEVRIDQHRRLIRIPVVKVVRRELKMPAEFSGRRIERE
jgi:hypothetical protein